MLASKQARAACNCTHLKGRRVPDVWPRGACGSIAAEDATMFVDAHTQSHRKSFVKSSELGHKTVSSTTPIKELLR